MPRFRDLRAQRPVKNAKPFSEKPPRCLWCGRRFGPKLKPTREHLLPLSLGGGGGKNLAAACEACNGARSNSLDWKPFGSPLDQMPDTQIKHLAKLRVGGAPRPTKKLND